MTKANGILKNNRGDYPKNCFVRSHKAYFILLLLILFLANPVVASDPVDIGSWMIKKGMDMWVRSIGDSMIELGNGGNQSVNSTETPGLIFRMITFTIDPFSLNWVKDWWGTMVIFYTFVVFLIILGGAAWVLIHSMFPDTAQRIDWMTDSNFSNFHFNKWLGNIVKSLFFPYGTYFGIYVILQLNYVISGLITAQTLEAVPPTTDNIVAYIMMALTYLGLSIIMGIRNIMIVLFAAGGLGLAALYLIPQLEDLIVNIFYYFLIIVFMQPLLIFIAAVGVTFIKNLPLGIADFMPQLYVALMILILAVAVVLILGPITVMRLIGLAKRVVIL